MKLLLTILCLASFAAIKISVFDSRKFDAPDDNSYFTTPCDSCDSYEQDHFYKTDSL